MGDSWIIGNLEDALETWSSKLGEIWELLTTLPQNFKGGGIWEVILNIHNAMIAIGLALLVLFFVVGVVKTCGSFADVKKPEHALKLFVRFAIAKIVVTYGMELLLSILSIVQGVVSKIADVSGISGASGAVLPQELKDMINSIGFLDSIPLWAITLLGSIFITVLSWIIIMTVYGRFFKLYIYTAISPLPMSAIAGEPTQNIGVSFIKSYGAVCLEGVIIILACVIFTVYVSSPPAVNTDASAVTATWSYIAELIFNMLVLVATIKGSDRIVREVMGI